jgi:two-component system NtrC family response regulator
MLDNGKILIIDDEPNLRILYTKLLSLEGFDVETASTGKQGLSLISKEQYRLVISDVKLPDISGLEILKTVKEDHPETEVIMITAYGKIKDGVEAIKTGAFDYVTKGDIDEDEFIFKVKNAFEKSLLRHEIKHLKGKVESKFGFSKISGRSKVILEAVDLARKVAETDATVLLLGETGTGKELFAHAIHNSSSRKNNTFVALNCSAIPKDLQESELFGYVKGAFTGAVKDKNGFFEEAHLGTIFLDEIGDISHETQAKLLRVLESGTFTKIGETKPVTVDVRIISATNKDLLSETENNNFRSDLYYRLNGFTIKLPSLSERTEDIEILANEFVKLYSGKSQIHVKYVSKEYIDKLKNYRWKGNIRELRNIIERSIILSKSETLTIDTLPVEFLPSEKSPLSVIQETDTSPANQINSLKEIEKNHILKIYSENNFNKTLTAEKLGIGSVTLYRKLKEYDVE